MIGYKEESGSRVYRVYDPINKQGLVTGEVVFDETSREVEHTTTLPVSEQELVQGNKEQAQDTQETANTPSEKED